MQSDVVDRVLDQWQRERPDLDAQALAVVGRILRLAGILERRANLTLEEFGIPIWAFDVLGTLRRHGKPYSMTPTELMQSAMLSSGAMTNRIDRLEKLGLVVRKPDRHDRRSLQVRLTPKGRKLVDAAAVVRFDEAADALCKTPPTERKRLAASLRQLLIHLEKL